MALQLYTVRDDFQRDPEGTLRAVAGIGYTAVKLASYGGMEAGQLRERLDELGLRAISSHVPLTDLRTRLDGALEKSALRSAVRTWYAPGYHRSSAATLRHIARCPEN